MEEQYLDLMRLVISEGEEVSDRTGTGTISYFGGQIRGDLQDGFPAITTKKLAWNSVVGELIWFLEGSTDERRLAEITFGKDRTELVGKRTIWTDNADHQGRDLGYFNGDLRKELGPVYGAQWRNFGKVRSESGYITKRGFDQVRWLINEIRTNPGSRRLVLSAWAADSISSMALPPCHVLAQFRVHNGRLSCHLYQRSADLFLGVPFNIASYALLTHIIARECGLQAGHLVHSFGDVHIYTNHLKQVFEQLSRMPYESPELLIHEDFDLNEVLEDNTPLDVVSKFELLNYEHHSFIKAPMAI